MRSPIEVEARLKVGSLINVMPLGLAIITLRLIRKLYVPMTLMLISDITNTKSMTLLISFDYLPDVINEYLT